jgi:flagellar biosynthesis GTPase FlhF
MSDQDWAEVKTKQQKRETKTKPKEEDKKKQKEGKAKNKDEKQKQKLKQSQEKNQPKKQKNEDSDEEEDNTNYLASTIYSQAEKILEEKQKRREEASGVAPIKKKKSSGSGARSQAAAQILPIKSKLDAASLNEAIQGFESKYPTDVALQLKLLAEFFEKCLAKVPIPRKELDELDFADQIEYPLSYLEDDSVLDAAWQYLSKVPEKELSDFLIFLLENWVDSVASGQKNSGKTAKTSMIGLGIQVLMDVILRHKPELIAGDKFITEKFKKKYMQQANNVHLLNGKTYGHQILYIVGQTLKSNQPYVALYLWFKLVLPTLYASKSRDTQIDKEILSFGELLAAIPKAKFRSSGSSSEYASPRAIEMLIELHYNRNVSSPDAKAKLEALYNHIISVALFGDDKSPRRYFTTLMKHVTEDQPIREVISELLVKSMLRDGGCSKVWREHYHEMIPQSHNLCLHFLENLDKIKSEKRGANLLRETFDNVKHFIEVNEALKQGTYTVVKDGKTVKVTTDQDELARCDATCHELSRALVKAGVRSSKDKSSRGGSGLFVFFLLLVLVLGVLVSLGGVGPLAPMADKYAGQLGITHEQLKPLRSLVARLLAAGKPWIK